MPWWKGKTSQRRCPFFYLTVSSQPISFTQTCKLQTSLGEHHCYSTTFLRVLFTIDKGSSHSLIFFKKFKFKWDSPLRSDNRIIIPPKSGWPYYAQWISEGILSLYNWSRHRTYIYFVSYYLSQPFGTFKEHWSYIQICYAPDTNAHPLQNPSLCHNLRGH